MMIEVTCLAAFQQTRNNITKSIKELERLYVQRNEFKFPKLGSNQRQLINSHCSTAELLNADVHYKYFDEIMTKSLKVVSDFDQQVLLMQSKFSNGLMMDSASNILCNRFW